MKHWKLYCAMSDPSINQLVGWLVRLFVHQPAGQQRIDRSPLNQSAADDRASGRSRGLIWKLVLGLDPADNDDDDNNERNGVRVVVLILNIIIICRRSVGVHETYCTIT